MQALYQFGLNTGIAFQIQDDLIDLLTPADKSGKDQGSDLREGKQTLIMIMARKKGVDLLKYRRKLSPADIKTAIQELTDAGVIDEVKNKALGLVADSNRLLSVLPATKERPAPHGCRRIFCDTELLGWQGTTLSQPCFCAHSRTR